VKLIIFAQLLTHLLSIKKRPIRELHFTKIDKALTLKELGR